MSGWVYAIDPGADWDTTSALVWKEQVADEDGIRAPLLVTEDVIYVALQNGFLYARDRADGSNIWRAPSSEDSTLGSLLSAPVYMSGNVLVSPMNESIDLVAYDADDGTRRWYYPLQVEE
jgi:outer membrane protein assembly factor BamB